VAIEGELTSLRALEPGDLERYLEWLNDPEVTRTLAQRYPISREAEREILERLSGAQSYENVVFAIDLLEGDLREGGLREGGLREGDTHVGTVGIHRATPENRSATLGVFIGAKEEWGKGYAFDAIRSALRFAFWEMNLRQVRLGVLDDNPRAIALYERLGFVHEGMERGEMWRRGRAIDHLRMSITREEFEALHGEPVDLRKQVLA
jgi:RimJ/RimL family protein N-acetyltransferase